MILGTICVRAGSKGVPGKNIRPLCGKPMILYTIDAAKKAAALDDIIISTDSEEAARLGKDAGINVPFMRPENLSNDRAGKWEVFKHALTEYEKVSNKSFEYLVDLDVTAPLKSSEDINAVIEFAKKHSDADLIYCGYEPDRNPYFTMVEINKSGYAELVKTSDTAIVRRQDAPEVYSLSSAVIVIKKEALLKYSHWTECKCKIFKLPRERAMDVDTELDFKFAEFLIQNKNN